MTVIKTIKIRKKLKSDAIKLGKEAKSIVGKNVEITTREVTEPKPVERNWSILGSVNLGGEFDCVNIRDFAYND